MNLRCPRYKSMFNSSLNADQNMHKNVTGNFMTCQIELIPEQRVGMLSINFTSYYRLN
jgi:hypothetical protein